MYINIVAKHPRNLNYSTKHVYIAQRPLASLYMSASLGVGCKHE